ncbi:MAG: hypothetical protein K2X28_02940 [Alphaproteobacteria bacterium]|nr:hypothetical protein [Alphaproteobacteria bacterium]
MKNPLVDTEVVMAAYAEDLLARLAKYQHTLVLMIDQSKVNAAFEVLMVSVRLRKRAVPLFWIVKETKGGIGFESQRSVWGSDDPYSRPSKNYGPFGLWPCCFDSRPADPVCHLNSISDLGF